MRTPRYPTIDREPSPRELNAAIGAIGTKEPAIDAGTTAQYRRGDKTWRDFATDVRTAVLTGLSTATNAVIAATDTVLSALGKLQAQINANVTALAGKASTGDNTFTGNQTIQTSGSPTLNIVSTSTGSALCSLDSQAGTLASLIFKTNGSNRWYFTKGSTAESGSNVGSDFELRAHTDAGAFGFRVFTIKRDSGDILFGRDNLQNVGGAANRAKEIWCGNSVINTSDAREKTDVTPLTAAELAAAADLARAIGTYQWLASIEKKGAESARHHAGLTVQRAIQIMQGHDLDPFAYGFICFDEWDELPEQWEDIPEELDDDGNVTREAGRELVQEYRPAGDRYSFRTDELLLFIARGFAARLDALETAR